MKRARSSSGRWFWRRPTRTAGQRLLAACCSRSVEAASNRLLVAVADLAAIDEAALRRLGVRGVARGAASRMQLILAGEAASAAAGIATLIAA